jgi:hypothetical protein
MSALGQKQTFYVIKLAYVRKRKLKREDPHKTGYFSTCLMECK